MERAAGLIHSSSRTGWGTVVDSASLGDT